MYKTRRIRHSQARTCAFWAKRLAALRPRDLAKPENADLAAHLKTCFFCQKLFKEYQEVAAMIQALPDLQMHAGLPPQLLAEWGETDDPGLYLLDAAAPYEGSHQQQGDPFSPPPWYREDTTRIASARDTDGWGTELPFIDRVC